MTRVVDRYSNEAVNLISKYWDKIDTVSHVSSALEIPVLSDTS